MFTDVGPSGAVTLRVGNIPPGFSYRTVKEPPAAFDRMELRANAGR